MRARMLGPEAQPDHPRREIGNRAGTDPDAVALPQPATQPDDPLQSFTVSFSCWPFLTMV